MPANFNANGEIEPEFTDAVLEFADEIVTYVLNELEGGMWRGQFAALSLNQKKALFAAIDDGFNDTVNN